MTTSVAWTEGGMVKGVRVATEEEKERGKEGVERAAKDSPAEEAEKEAS